MLNSFMIWAVTLARAKPGVNDRRKSRTAAVPELLNCTNFSRLEVPDKAMSPLWATFVGRLKPISNSDPLSPVFSTAAVSRSQSLPLVPLVSPSPVSGVLR